jgi:hypothetical protein
VYAAKSHHPAGRQSEDRWCEDPEVSERACLVSTEIVAGTTSYPVSRSSLLVVPPDRHEGIGVEKQWKGEISDLARREALAQYKIKWRGDNVGIFLIRRY